MIDRLRQDVRRTNVRHRFNGFRAAALAGIMPLLVTSSDRYPPTSFAASTEPAGHLG